MSERYRVLLRTVPFLTIGLLIFILYLVLFVDISEMIIVIQSANMLIYSLAASSLILATFLFALTWHYLLLPLSVKIPLRKTFAYVWIGVFTDLLIPAESLSGEIAKTYMMSREPNVNSGKVIASLVSQRILGTIVTTAILFTGFIALLTLNFSISSLMVQILVLMTAVSAVAFGFLVMVCVKQKWTERLVIAVVRFAERLSRGRFKLEQLRDRITDALRVFYESLRIFGSNPIKLLPAIIFNVLSWLFSIAIVFLVFASIGYLEPNISILLLEVAVVYTLLVAIKSIPIGVPAEVGLPDIAMATLFILFGIPPDVSAAATILTRMLTVWLSFFIGFVAVQWFGVKSLMESGVFGRTKDKV